MKGVAILAATLLIATSFVVFFDVSSDTDLSIVKPDTSPTLDETETYKVRLEIADEERVPIEHISLKWQRIDQDTNELEIAKDVRWKPVCKDDGKTGLRTLPGYGDGVVESIGKCDVTIGGETSDADGDLTVRDDALGYGYLKVQGTGYGYANLAEKSTDVLEGGYGYRCNQEVVDDKGQHACIDNQDPQSNDPSSDDATTPLDSYFILTDAADDPTAPETQERFGYGDGYGYNEQGQQEEVVLTWTVPVELTSDEVSTDERYELVAVVWTGSGVLRTLQTNQNTFTVTPQEPSPTSSGPTDDDDDGTAAKTVVKSIGNCGSSCSINLGTDVNSGDTVRIHFGSSDDLFSYISFDATADLGSQVEIDRHEPDERPSGVDDPGSIADPRYYFDLDVTSGGSSVADDTENWNVLWKLRHEWLNGTLSGHERDMAYTDSHIKLGHFEASDEHTGHEHGWKAESTSRETANLPSSADTSVYRMYNSSFDTLSTFAAGAFDATAPSFSGASPTGAIQERQPTISVDVSDGGSGVNADSIEMMLDGQTVQHSFSDGTVSYTPSSDLSFDTHDVTVTAEDDFGNEGNTSWTFTVEEVVDSVAPTITNLEPAPDSTVQSDATISASYSDDMSGIDLNTVTLTVDGEDVTSDADVTSSSISYAPDGGFDGGDHTAELTVSDVAGNQQTESWSFNVEAGNLMIIVIGIVAIIVIAAIAAWYLLVYQKQQ